MIPILYDGWSLTYSPNSPGALHLLTLLEASSEEFEPIVALPGAPPAWLPERLQTRVEGAENTPTGRLIWEQRKFPGLARQVGAKLVHITSQSAALFAPVKSVLSPADFIGSLKEELAKGFTDSIREVWEPDQPEGLAERLRRSLSRGTQNRILSLFWPEDLPYDESKAQPSQIKKLPPVVHPAFLRDQEQGISQAPHDLPDTYLLYQGPYNRLSIQTLLQAWSWAAGPIGEDCPLVLVGAADNILPSLEHMLQTSGLRDSLRVLPPLAPVELSNLFRSCKGLFHPAPPSIWEGPLRHALSCGRAIIASHSPFSEALLGPAAYLVPNTDFRGMGAALITVVLEDEVEGRLSQAARERSAKWKLGLFREKLARSYQELAAAG